MPRLAVGVPAPHFAVQDLQGKTWTPASLRGKRALLAFHRFAACPFCNFRVHQMKVRFPALQQRGLGQVLAFFESGAAPLTTLSERQAVLPYPVIPDPDHRVYDLYGLEKSVVGFLKVAPQVPGFMRGNREAGVSVTGLEMDGNALRMPAEFMLDEEGIIRGVHYGKDAGDHVPFETIESWLK